MCNFDQGFKEPFLRLCILLSSFCHSIVHCCIIQWLWRQIGFALIDSWPIQRPGSIDCFALICILPQLTQVSRNSNHSTVSCNRIKFGGQPHHPVPQDTSASGHPTIYGRTRNNSLQVQVSGTKGTGTYVHCLLYQPWLGFIVYPSNSY